MLDVSIEALTRTFTISVSVFVMMLLVDYVNVLTRGSLAAAMKRGRPRQYLSATFLGATPGCLGAFMAVSFYQHGLISFGATVGCMVATSGDEAFVMIASFPGYALLLFGVLFVLGLGFGWLADAVGPLFGPRYGEGCKVEVLHDEDECCRFDREEIWRQLRGMSFERGLLLAVFAGALIVGASGVLDEKWEGVMVAVLAAMGLLIVATTPDHYLRAHIVGHIVREHLWKVVLWTFFALLTVGMGLKYWDLESFVERHTLLWVFLAGLVGLIPQSGPHLIFVTMFARGLVPFSVLLTSSIVQEGHALLPLLSCSVRDALTTKAMKLVLALIIGIVLHALGW